MHPQRRWEACFAAGPRDCAPGGRAAACRQNLPDRSVYECCTPPAAPGLKDTPANSRIGGQRGTRRGRSNLRVMEEQQGAVWQQPGGRTRSSFTLWGRRRSRFERSPLGASLALG